MSRACVIYVRISEDREGAGLGVDRQESDCRELADRLGWTVVDVKVDNDVSAYTGKPRPGYRALLEDLRSGRADAVVVWHTDRLHRSPVELEEYVQVCEGAGVVTQTVKAGPLDLATPSGRLVARQLGAVARYEVEHNVERLQAKRLQTAKAGKWPGGRRPFGYEPDGVTIRESEAAEIHKATEQVIAGASLRSLAADLNARGVTTSTRKAWKPSELRGALLRPRNAGLMQHRGEVIGEAEWPAIVDPDTWRACRAVLTDKRRRTNTGAVRRWMGSGLYQCAVCDGTVRATSSPGTHPSYTCDPARHVFREAAAVDDLVTAVVLGRLSQPDAADLLAPRTADTSHLHTEAAGLRARLDELARLYADGTIDGSQLAEGSQSLREALGKIEQQMAAGVATTALSGFHGRDPAKVWAGLDIDRRRAVVDALVTVTIHKARKGRPPGWKPGESYFDPRSVEIQWKAPA